MTSQAKKTTKKDKGSKVQKSTLSYQELAAYINPENYWIELEGILEDQRNHFVNHLTLRYYISKIPISKLSGKLKNIFRSASAIDELMVNFEGEMYPLREVADVSKKDPKRVIIDTSAIPQVTK